MVTNDVPFQSVMQRTGEVLSAIKPSQRTPAIREIEELHRDMTETPGTGRN
jgi:hypothetical protein